MHLDGTVVGKFLVAALVAGCCWPAQARAQTVFGTVVDEGARPVSGALVTLRDARLQPTVRVLTDNAGKFFVHAHAGQYTFSIEHIGFARVERIIDVPAGDPLKLELQLATAPVLLKSIVAEGKGRCGSTKDPHAAQLWYLAQTALGTVTAETTKLFRVRNYSRELNARLDPRGEERVELVTASSTRPYRAMAATSLLTDGFVQQKEDGLWFYGPDADLLLSDEFVNGHCFRVSREKSRKDLIGLAFSPGSSRLKHDIRGTMWLSEQTGELKFVEYFYTGIDSEVEDRLASGRVEFERMTDGGWMVRRWYIRMPLYSVQYLPTVWQAPGRRSSTIVGAPVRRLTVHKVVEEGGEVIEVQVPRRAPSIGEHCTDAQLHEAADVFAYPADKLGALIGRVTDAASPIAGARVRVYWDPAAQPEVAINRNATEAIAVTDEKGGFTLCGLPIELDLQIEITEGDVIIKRDLVARGRERAIQREFPVTSSDRRRT